MADSRADELIKRQEGLAAERRGHERDWQEIAELVKPMRAEFAGPVKKADGGKLFDGTAGYAADNFSAGLWGMTTNSANEWFQMQHSIEELNQDRAVRLWLDEATRLMRVQLAANGQRFYSQVHPLFGDMVCFGAGVFYTEERAEKGAMFYSCRSLAECFISEGADENVDELHRRYQSTAKQILQRFKDATPAKIREAAEKNPEQKFTLIHSVLPREELDLSRKDMKGKPFASYYVDVDSRTVIGERGYFEFPYQVPRWGPGLYGYSRASLAMPDVRMLNAMSKTTIIGAQKRVDPTILARDEDSVHGIKTGPGKIIYGGVDDQGRQLIHPLQTGADIGLGLEMEEQRRGQIREAFYASLLLMVQRPNMTATQFLGEQEEKLRLMAPYLGKVQSEFHDPLIDRLFAVMYRAGAFPPPPEVLLQYPDLKVDYVSPLARAQKASEGAAISRALEAIAPLAAVNPEVWDNFDGDAAARTLAEAYGVPAKLIRDPKAVAQARDARAQKMSAAMLPGQAEQAAGAIKTAAEAGAALQEQGLIPAGGANA